MAKDITREYFSCASCGHIRFSKEYVFSMEFKNVDFSDDPVYDRVTEEIYVCKGCKCRHKISLGEIIERLREIKAKHKHIDKDNGDV